MRFIYLLLLIFLLPQFSSCNGPRFLDPPHIEIARNNIGVPPTDSINGWLRFVGLGPNNPWCAAALSSWLHQANVRQPQVRSGLARDFATRSPARIRVSAGRVLIGAVAIPRGSLVVFRRGDTIFGHVGIATEHWRGQTGMYISGNTSRPGSGGSEFSGGGVWEKPVSIVPSAHLRITEFVYVIYF